MLHGEPELCPHWTRVDGRRMFARVSAERTPDKAHVILLHGLGVSSSYMAPLGKMLARNYNVWAPDLPGYGRSEKPRRTFDIPQLATALLHWMDQCAIDCALICANSMGCQVAVELAAREPARVAALTLIGPTFDHSTESLFRNAVHLFQDAVREPLSLIPLQTYDYLHNGPFKTIKAFFYARAHPIAQRLAAITAPTVVMWGERDPIVSRGWAEQVAAALPNASLVVVPEAAHAVNYNTPEVVAQTLEASLQKSPR